MPRDSSREVILARAVQLASLRGLEGLTIGGLAEDVQMSKGGISAHFRSKLDLQLATVERAAQVFQDAVVLPTRSKRPGKARLEALDDAWFQYLDDGIFEGGCFFTNAMLELDDLALSEVRDAVVTQYNRLLDYVEHHAKEAIQKGEFRNDLDANRFALEWIGVKLGAILWRGLGRTPNPSRDAASALIRRVSVKKH